MYFAPSRHKADTEFTEEDGDHHLEHRLRFCWQAARGLAWVCSGRRGNRNIEIEAAVYPDDDERWSPDWESNSATKYTQHNLPPGPIHQDDIASGGEKDYCSFRGSDYKSCTVDVCYAHRAISQGSHHTHRLGCGAGYLVAVAPGGTTPRGPHRRPRGGQVL